MDKNNDSIIAKEKNVGFSQVPTQYRWKRGFAGWYCKHQCGNDMIALIPGISESGAFVQIITPNHSRQFRIQHLKLEDDVLFADNCRFSKRGCIIDLPGVQGGIKYGTLSPLRSDIMGPFRHLPMQCRHGVISMEHSLWGGITVDGNYHAFDGGHGYMEMDCGTSFPNSYLWVQCNDFPTPCAFMLSVAHIPFCGFSFSGCICSILFAGEEYRLATYCGVKIRAVSDTHICLTQGNLLLQADMIPAEAHPLLAPCHGKMSDTIRESNNAILRLRLWKNRKRIFDLESPHAAYEYVEKTHSADSNSK